MDVRHASLASALGGLLVLSMSCQGEVSPLPDAGPSRDAAVPEPVRDAGTFDGGVTLDAGAGDAGSGDAGAVDGGQGLDASTPGAWDLRSQLPAGAWTEVTDVSWSMVSPPGWSIATNRPGPAPVVVEDPSAPDGDRFILRQPYGGTGDGDEPQFPVCYWPASNEVYAAMLVRFASTWQQPTSSGVKWHIFEGMPNELPGWMGLGAGTPAGTPRLGWTFNFGAATGVPPDRNLPQVMQRSFVPGRWHKMQYLVRATPPRVAIWLDDAVIADSDRMGSFSWASPAQNFSGLQMGGTWGGGIGFSAPAGNVIDYAHTLILRR